MSAVILYVLRGLHCIPFHCFDLQVWFSSSVLLFKFWNNLTPPSFLPSFTIYVDPKLQEAYAQREMEGFQTAYWVNVTFIGALGSGDTVWDANWYSAMAPTLPSYRLDFIVHQYFVLEDKFSF